MGGGVGEGVFDGTGCVVVGTGLKGGVSNENVTGSAVVFVHGTKSKMTRLQKIIFIFASRFARDYNSTCFS